MTANEPQNRSRPAPATGGPLQSAWLALRFGIELATIGVLAWAGASASAGLAVRIVLAIGLPVVLIVIWGWVMAPSARRRLPDPARLYAEVAIYLAAAAGLAFSGHTLASTIYGIIAIGAAVLSRRIAPEA